MSAQRQIENTISQDEYFDILLNGDIKYEWYNGQMWPVGNPDNSPHLMAGAQPIHNQLKSNVEFHLRLQLRGSSCFTNSSDQQIRVEATDLLAFPDVLVACEDARFENVRGLGTLLNPVVIVEILSPSTARFDRSDKWLHYGRISSLRDYLVIFSDQMRVEHHARQDNGAWLERAFSESHQSVELSGVAVRLTLRDVYEMVDLNDPPTSTAHLLPRP